LREATSLGIAESINMTEPHFNFPTPKWNVERSVAHRKSFVRSKIASMGLGGRCYLSPHLLAVLSTDLPEIVAYKNRDVQQIPFWSRGATSSGGSVAL
jgi:hypothetical protein